MGNLILQFMSSLAFNSPSYKKSISIYNNSQQCAAFSVSSSGFYHHQKQQQPSSTRAAINNILRGMASASPFSATVIHSLTHSFMQFNHNIHDIFDEWKHMPIPIYFPSARFRWMRSVWLSVGLSVPRWLPSLPNTE